MSKHRGHSPPSRSAEQPTPRHRPEGAATCPFVMCQASGRFPCRDRGGGSVRCAGVRVHRSPAGAAGPTNSGDRDPGLGAARRQRSPRDRSPAVRTSTWSIPSNETFSSADGLSNNTSASTSSSARLPTASCRPSRRPATATPSRATRSCPTPDGSFTYDNYPVYALPDSVSLGEGSSGPHVVTPRPPSASSTSGTTRTTSPSRTCGRSRSSSRRTATTVARTPVTAPPRSRWRSSSRSPPWACWVAPS